MLSNARGKHSSPGVYIEEIDMPYAVKNLGGTTLGVVGETLKGPAFEPIQISDWNEFQDYFGGTSTEKYKGNGYPKYELPYIAKSFLQESKQLTVCRVLGFSGYNAGPLWAITTQDASSANTCVVAVLRSKASYSYSDDDNANCDNNNSNYDKLNFNVKNVEITGYTTYKVEYTACTTNTTTGTTSGSTLTEGEYGKFGIKVTLNDTGETSYCVNVSLNPADKDYILNVLGNKPDEGNYDIFVEELYDNIHANTLSTSGRSICIISGNTHYNYGKGFSYASTPWFVSELKGNDVKKLFRFHTISDGDCANYQIKISISNILPDEGLFDVLIRDFNDTDATPVILERYTKCNLIPGTSNYLGLKIGTFDGEFANKSKYVTVEINSNSVIENCVPCGFLGYPMRKYDTIENRLNKNIYNLSVDENLKPNRQYFGISDISGIDVDVFKYKGCSAYTDTYNTIDGYTNGFHLDSTINANTGRIITVDGLTGYAFETVSNTKVFDEKMTPLVSNEAEMEKTIYNDKRLRKFTCCPYGGFDGWDIYRNQRTNTSDFKYNKYKGKYRDVEATGFTEFTAFDNSFYEASVYGLSGRILNSDYYAYLAGYKQFENPDKVKINLLATPGIDYVNNKDLVNEVLDIVEDSRQGDCLYVVTTPDTNVNGVFIEPDEAVANLDGSEINTSYAATYYPWVKYYDATNKKYINLPATKDVLRNFAYTDNVSQPWFASAGMSRGNVDCVKANLFTKLEDEDALYEGMINPIKSFSADGVKIWGNKTMYFEDTPLNRINVRRLMIRIKDLVMSASKQLIFEQNDNTLERQFRSIIDPILADAKQKRGISDYKIKTDNSPEARDRKELPAKIWIKPINCLEYIPISFVITPEGSNFED